MSLLDVINTGFRTLLETYDRGISNTSTTKYDEIKQAVADELGLDVEDVYATGAGGQKGRISNLDTRLAQGNQRNQHAPLALAFIRMPTAGKPREQVVEKARESFTTTASKFITGEERGTSFDGILGLLQLDDDDHVQPLRLLDSDACMYADKLKAAIPGLDEKKLQRITAPPVAQATVITAAAATAPSGTAAIDAGLIAACHTSLVDAGLQIAKPLLTRFAASLLAKRFVILAGLAGSGKTKLALGFAKWFEEVEGQVQVVAVGADWTSNEHVLGYRDALDDSKYRRPTSGALDVILDAHSDRNRPYFLILDEMNLSHVERYFSDLLSAIESGEQLSLHSGADLVDGVPPQVELPPNLFIVGTVNVDETTYMFSPKVLDRANVIEFRAESAELLKFLDAPKAPDLSLVAGKGLSYAPVFLDAASSMPASLKDLPSAIADGTQTHELLKSRLRALFDVLAPIGAEFGFRTAHEVARFTFFHALLSGSGWQLKDALDAQLVQKLMPKLNGSERRLRPVLDALGVFATDHQLHASGLKVDRMRERLRDGFVSFLD